ncbi:MAG: glycosyltransferase family 2 protein [Ferroplasma sp.]
MELFEIIVGLSIAMYTPITVYSLYALVKRRIHYDRNPDNQIVEGRKIIVEIITNGQNPDVVEDIISTLNTYKVSFETYVLKEEDDNFAYSAKEIVIPSGYKTTNNSFKKMRALQYGIEWLHSMGYGPETYIIHLDDDSIIDESYIKYVLSMKELAGQGSLRLRDYGAHLLSTLSDMNRVSDCDIYCKNFNEHGKPKKVHGEGLVIRSDVEYEIGWDYGVYGAEDLIMGISIPERGYSFGYIPDYIYISPPASAKDFYKQRRRWNYGMMESMKIIGHTDWHAMAFILYRNIVGFFGMVGITIWIIGMLFGIHFPLAFSIIEGFNLFMYFFIYENGVWHTNHKYILWMALLIIPVVYYESGTFIYTLIWPPKKNSFDVIKKIRIKEIEPADKK